jgi:hypothetical protein
MTWFFVFFLISGFCSLQQDASSLMGRSRSERDGVSHQLR